MALQPNPYFIYRTLYEVKGERESALKQLNTALETKIGKPAFHSFNKELFATKSTRDPFARFHHAIAHHLYHPRPMGSTDFLSVPYHNVFKESWNWYPNLVWLIELFIKDFNKPSLDQLYINPVSAEEYGDSISPKEIAKVLKKNRLAGLLALSTDTFRPFGIPLLDLEQVELVPSTNWRGLKEYIQKHLAAIPYPSSLPEPNSIWENMQWVFPEKVVEKGLDFLFGDFNREKDVLTGRWASLSRQSTFLKSFKSSLEKCRKSYPELIPYWPEYLGLETEEPDLFAGELALALDQQRDFSDFVARWFT